MGRVLLLFFFGVVLNPGNALAQLRLRSATDSATAGFNPRVLPQNFYNQHLSFFCRKELQLQKLTSLPIYIRAGSKEHVDYLEQKPNALWRPK